MVTWMKWITAGLAAGGVAAAGPVDASTVVLSANLTGATVPGGGAPEGAATFRVEAEPALGDFCYVLSFKDVGKASGAVIIPAEAEGDAKALVAMDLTGPATDMCIAVEPKVLEPIMADPGKFHVIVRSGAYPKGAVRGALTKQ